MNEPLVTILDGNTFVVSDVRGDIEASASGPTGLFSSDTRFLSNWVLTVDGRRLEALSADDRRSFETRFFLVARIGPAPKTGGEGVGARLSVIRHRLIGDGFRERLTILNHDVYPVDVTVRVAVGCDFADLFEVRNPPRKIGQYSTRTGRARLVLGYQRGTFRRETVIASGAPARVDDRGFEFTAHLDPNGEWSTELEVTAVIATPARGGRAPSRSRRERCDELERWIAAAPTLHCDRQSLVATYRRSLLDLAALRLSPAVAGGGSLPAAGLPWFMTVFGRDSILTSLQALPFAPELAATTIRVLGAWQGTRVDDFREEEPGRILHEIRHGELSAFGECPHSPYFGSADATPLFVVLLDEYERFSGDARLVRAAEPAARAALSWIDRYGDLMGNGYVSYRPRNERAGLENQCWKDSRHAICYADGRLPGFPRATCELQGYAYDGKRRGARLARRFWGDPQYADRLEREAADLKHRFNRDFWIADGRYYALALDADGTRVDALTSNIGHLLWSGIVDDDKARSVADHLLGPRLFSGWGVRTLAEGSRRYHPLGYHVGTVWPFDNSFIAWGLRRYGFAEQAATLAAGMLDAAGFFGGRLPEAFGGYRRALTEYPVRYPPACSPQAWSAGAPLLLLRTMLGLEPVGDHLVVDPALPAGIGRVELLDIPGRWGRADAFGRGRGPPAG